MNFYIVIPAHNEQDSIADTLDSLINQTLQPKEIVIVNDNSTDATAVIVNTYINLYSWINLVNNTSSNEHLPGSKIINAFYKGYDLLDDSYDIICKFDADLIFPYNYLEKLSNHFNANPKLGMVSGFCYIKKDDDWILENLTRKDHIRGALKAYRKDCFLDIGKLKPSMGWIVWDKGQRELTMSDGELAYSSFNSRLKIITMFRAKIGMNGGYIHPTQKPVALYKWLLKNYAKEGDKILDTHLGSGSIAIACDNLGFDLEGYELDKEYFEAASKRLKQHQSQLRIY